MDSHDLDKYLFSFQPELGSSLALVPLLHDVGRGRFEVVLTA